MSSGEVNEQAVLQAAEMALFDLVARTAATTTDLQMIASQIGETCEVAFYKQALRGAGHRQERAPSVENQLDSTVYVGNGVHKPLRDCTSQEMKAIADFDAVRALLLCQANE